MILKTIEIMKKLIFLLLLALPFVGFGQAAYLMEFTNPNGSKVVFNLNDVRSCVAEGTGSYLFTRTGSGKTQVQESPATIATNSCGNIVLFTVYSPANQFNDTKQMGVNPNYVVGVVSNTSGNGVLKMITPTENFTTTSTYNTAVALLSICVSGGGGGGSLTNTYVGFGDGLNQLDGEAGFTYDAESNRLAVDTVKTKRISSKSGPLEILNDTKFNTYPNTRDDSGGPANILNTDASGNLRSDPVSSLKDSLARHFWAINGNIGTTPGTNFIGTTDNQDLVFKRNGFDWGYFNSNGTTPALGNPAGDAKLSFGPGNLSRTTATGRETIAIGAFNLSNATSGTRSIAMGRGNLYNTTTGSQNITIGHYNVYSNVTGSENHVIGQDNVLSCTAAQGNNVLGRRVLVIATTATQNSVIGNWTLDLSSLSANQNSVLGNFSFRSTINSQNLTGVGYGCSAPSTVSNSTALGANTTIDKNDQTVLGGTGTTEVKFRGETGYNYGHDVSATLGAGDDGKVWTYEHASSSIKMKPVVGVTLSPVGSTPNANAATLSGSTLNLQPANASFPGVVTAVAQTFSGQKTINMASSGAVTQNLILDNTATAAVNSATSMAQSVAGVQRGEVRTTLTEIVGGGADYAKVEIKAQNGGALKEGITIEAKNAGVDNVSIWAGSDGALTTARRIVEPYNNVNLTGDATLAAGYSHIVLTGTQILTDAWTVTMPPSADMLDGEILTISNSIPGVTGATLQLTANSGQTLLGFTGTASFANTVGFADRRAIQLMFKSGGTWITLAQY